jgi:uncharacterized pyridoxal phosphate-containing UPF0001 family protein
MGREELERKLKNWKLPLSVDEAVNYLSKHYKLRLGTEVYALIATGKLDFQTIKEILNRHLSGEAEEERRAAAAEIERQCEKIGKVMDVLVEVNSGREPNKGGLLPEQVEDFCRALADFPHLRLRGFMTMAPKCEHSEQYQKYFSQTYRECLDIWQKKLDNIGSVVCAPVMSMGMSDSFEAAVREGATIVRVGGALFRDAEA